MFKKVNTHVLATREKKRLQQGTPVDRDMKEIPSRGEGAKEFSLKYD
jgi:hypothetical protein